MNIKRLTATVAVVSLLLGLVAAPALAERGGNGHKNGKGNGKSHVSEKFDDMGEFQWGLSDVTKMEVKGIFKGRGDKTFAPGAKINHQETAVAVVRLIGKADEAQALSPAEVDSLLKNMPDQSAIATWARPAVAELVKQGSISGSDGFGPVQDETRLEVAVLLVKSLGLEQEARDAQNAVLSFHDAHLIPDALAGYVSVAVNLRLITGYDDKTFRPNQPVKRVEMAVMMGRTDGLIDRHKQDEIRGTIKSVDVAGNAFSVTLTEGQDRTLTLADDASIFVDNLEKSLTDLAAGMHATVKLNSQGEAVYVEAKSAPALGNAVTGTISALIPPTATTLGLITVSGHIYPLAGSAAITVNNSAAAFADLKIGDAVALTLSGGLATKVAVTRNQTAVTGAISALTLPTGTAAGSVTVNGAAYVLPASATVTVDNSAAALADLKVGDSVTLTVVAGQATQVAVTRTTAVNGSIATLQAPTATALGTITIGTTVYPVSGQATFTLNGTAAVFADLKLGDTVALTVASGQVTRVAATRAATVIDGDIFQLVSAVPANGTTPATPAQIGVAYMNNSAPVQATYSIQANTQILVNGAAAQFSDLGLGNSVKLTLLGDALTKVEVTR
ncbi:MAG TPA: S-layer homology domain-containing protein [Symbiobacteriaceae bacterium]|jgi:hypothetical protein